MASIYAHVFAVYDDPLESVVDCRLDIVVPAGNGNQFFGTSLLVDRANLPLGYTWDDLAAQCTILLDTPCITVGVYQPPEG